MTLAVNMANRRWTEIGAKALLMMMVLTMLGGLMPFTMYHPHAGDNGDGELGDYSTKLEISVGDDGELSGSTVSNGDAKGSTIKTGNKIIKIITTIYTLIAAGAAIVLAIIFIVHAVSLAKNGSNPQGKSMSVNGLILTGVAAALVGGSAVFVAVFFNVFR